MIISILLWLLFGAVIGLFAGYIMKVKKGLVMSIILGIVGAIVGGFIASLLGFGEFGGTFSFNIVNILISVGGACLIVFIARALKLIN